MSDATRTRDAWLAMRCQLGEAAAFRELVTEMEGPLLYFASKLLGSERNAPGVVQDVWVQAFAKINKLRDPGSLRAWLYQLTRALAVGRNRGDVARERREATISDETPLSDDDVDARISRESAATPDRQRANRDDQVSIVLFQTQPARAAGECRCQATIITSVDNNCSRSSNCQAVNSRNIEWRST